MNEVYDDTMTHEILDSDGEYTIGYVDGRAAEWDGNTHSLVPGDRFDWKGDGCYFGIHAQDEYRVDAEGRWEYLGA